MLEDAQIFAFTREIVIKFDHCNFVVGGASEVRFVTLVAGARQKCDSARLIAVGAHEI